jgi:putative RecB family exonuclease
MQLSELRKTPHLSASAINNYVECGLLYKFGKIDKIPIEGRSCDLELGSIIHLCLEEYYLGKMTGTKIPLKSLQKCFESHWTERAKDKSDIKYSKGKDFESVLLLGKELLSAWYNKLIDDGLEVVAVEEAFSVLLPGIPIPMIGGIDLIEQDDAGTLIVTDFKTTGKAYSNDEVDKNMQLLLYQIAVKKNGYADREILLRFDCLIKTKTPKFETYYTTRNELDEKRLIKKIQTVWNGINQGVFVPNDTSWKCKNCFYKTACDEWFEERSAA